MSLLPIFNNVAAFSLLLAIALWLGRRRHSIAHIRGPPSAKWLAGETAFGQLRHC